MTLEVAAAADGPVDDDSLAKRSKDTRHHIKSMVGVTCDMVVKRPGEVPRSQGKAVRVRDLREA